MPWYSVWSASSSSIIGALLPNGGAVAGGAGDGVRLGTCYSARTARSDGASAAASMAGAPVFTPDIFRVPSSCIRHCPTVQLLQT